MSIPTVRKWRNRYLHDGMAGLLDADRPGRPRQHIDHASIVSARLMPPPKKYGVTHLSSRLLAGHLGVGNATIARAWRESPTEN
ncbi:helix-turn-helix domain-containing protein [Gordonia sp. PP30]|uniref:helix-turn-helix domain-containing protein n=1 Tax=unclassified Gordonia (in: high G+C Gram-positive bacteria) TaxID=2657482 RepID=UPI001FFF51DE|nr:helix-turn-helix domain-containing protein [Gordonia sp. PP30]UQE76862.1 helix-turn-helix domain-containing protein [Gordonia sp. PP30]